MLKDKKYILPAVFTVALMISLGVFFGRNSSTGIIGTDEALYIFLAKGHVTTTPVYDAPQDFVESFKVWISRSGDPPGVYVFLRLWGNISFREMWLRTIPYLFYIQSILLLILIGFILNLPPLFAVSLGVLPLASYYMNLYSLEIRGYGMEASYNYLIILLALIIVKRIELKKSQSILLWAAFTLAVAIGLTTRVTFVISATSMYLCLWLFMLIRRRRIGESERLLPLFVSSAVSAAVFGLIFLMLLGRHFGIAIFAPETNMPVYTAGLSDYVIEGGLFEFLKYYMKQFIFLPAAILGGAGVLHNEIRMLCSGIISLCLGVIIIGLVIGRLKNNDRFSASSGFSGAIPIIGLAFPIILFCITMAFGAIGLHPFSTLNRWGVFLQPAIHTGFAAVSSYALFPCGQLLHSTKMSTLRKAAPYVMSVLAVFYIYCFSTYHMTIRGGGPHNTVGLVHEVTSRERISAIDGWYVSYGEVSAFKYHVLYGGLAGLVDGGRVWFESFPDSTTTDSEMGALAARIAPGGTVVMITGHVDERDEERYRSQFGGYFKVDRCSGYDSWYAGEACIGVK